MSKTTNYPDINDLQIFGFKKQPSGEWTRKIKSEILKNGTMQVDNIRGDWFLFIWCEGGQDSLDAQCQVCIHRVPWSVDNFNSIKLLPL